MVTITWNRGRLMSQKYQPHKHPMWLLLLLWLDLAVPELTLHIATAKNNGTLLNPGLLLPLLFAVVPALVIYLLCTMISSPAVRKRITNFYAFICMVFCVSQTVYFKVFGTFYTFYSLANGASALQFVNTIVNAVRDNLVVLGAMILPFVLTLILSGQACNYQPIHRFLPRLMLAVAAVLAQVLLVLALPVFGGIEDSSPYGLYHTNSDSYTTINKLGLFTGFRLDIQRSLSGDAGDGDIVIQAPAETTGGLEIPAQTPAPTEPERPAETTVSEPTTEPQPVIDTSPNVLDINFDALIAQETDKSVLQVHQYFASRTASGKNAMTGVFEDCNLIMITAEAFSYLAVSETRTPTLYKLMNEGISFANYYVPDWGVSTTDGEYAFLTGTVPKNGVWSFKKSAENYMPLTMSMQLLDEGYSAYAYHGHTYTYYGRDLYLNNLGFAYKGLGNGLDITEQWPESDLEVINASVGDYINSEAPFVTYYMSISGHREFNFTGNMVAYKNKALVAEESYSTNVRAYLACQLELEKALTQLLADLEESGQLENTVIVLTADHYPNGLTAGEIGELLGHTPESNFEIYQNGAFIWKYGMDPIVVEEPSSHLDLLPTLSNLFGLEFDSRLYMGRDVFSDAQPLVMFRNRSWITDRAMYNADTKKVTSLTGEEITQEYIDSINNEVSNRFTVSSRILDYDYWSILFE